MKFFVTSKTMMRRGGQWVTLEGDGTVSRTMFETADEVTPEEMPTAHEGRAFLRAGYQHPLTPAVAEAAQVAADRRIGGIIDKPDPPAPKVNKGAPVHTLTTALRRIDELQAQVDELLALVANLQVTLDDLVTGKPKVKPAAARKDAANAP